MYFFVCRSVCLRCGSVLTTRASTTVDVAERPDVAENLLTSGVVGGSKSGTAVGRTTRSSSLSNRCPVILSCIDKPRATLVAIVGDVIKSSTTSLRIPWEGGWRACLFRTVTLLMRLSSHSLSTSLTSAAMYPQSASQTTTGSGLEPVSTLGVVDRSASDSKQSPKPTSRRFRRPCFPPLASTSGFIEGKTGREIEKPSSSDEYGFSRAVMNESEQEFEGCRSFG